MRFETKTDVLNWYEKQPRTLTKEFIDSIPWHEVKKYPIRQEFIPVLLYMRDVEVLTDMYHEEMKRTPTGKDPVISKFMERWGIEEITHGEVINRFLNEAGIETGDDWRNRVNKSVSKYYSAHMRVITTLTNLIGKKFTATHMTFGAINELTTGQAYRRMIELANHPVLTQILTGIIREEAAHTRFYWSVARLELQKSDYAQKIARFVIKNYWTPVGEGARTKKASDYAIQTLFKDDRLKWIDDRVTSHVQQLPGFEGLNTVSETIHRIALGDRSAIN